jgi:hypothetical protein
MGNSPSNHHHHHTSYKHQQQPVTQYKLKEIKLEDLLLSGGFFLMTTGIGFAASCWGISKLTYVIIT